MSVKERLLWLYRLTAIMAMAAFIVPCCTVTCSGGTEGLSALDIVLGSKALHWTGAAALLVTPALALLAALSEEAGGSDLRVANVLSGTVMIAVSIRLRAAVEAFCAANGGTYRMQAGYEFFLAAGAVQIAEAVFAAVYAAGKKAG